MALLEGPTLLLLAVFGALLCYRYLLRTPQIRRDGVPLRRPPNTLPLVGNGILFLQPRQKLFSWFVKCEDLFGRETFQISVPTLPPGVVINDPRNLDYVFKNEGLFSKGDLFKRLSRDLFGAGIINVDGELWKAQRRVGLAFLSASNLRVLTHVALPRYRDRATRRLSAHARAGSVADLQSVFHEITSQLMGKMAYDMEMHSDDDFTVAFEYSSGVTAGRFQNPLWFITEAFTGRRFRRALATIRAFGNSIVEHAVSVRSTQGGEGVSRSDKLDEISGGLIRSLLEVFGDDRNLVTDAALNYLSAGRDTVAQALTWSMHLLMQHRFVLEKIREEAQAFLDAFDASGAEAGCGADVDVKSVVFTPVSLPYTMAVFYEALRLYPPIPFEIKQCERATTLPDGTFLPEKSIIFWCTWAMNRSKASWGDDADAFRPERWLTAEGKLVMKSASEFPVFNGGPRLCLGKRMAELMACQVLATMVLMFDFVPAYETERVSKSSLTLPMQGGLPCLVKQRANTRRGKIG